MKIPGKLPFQTIVKKLPQSTDVDKIFNVQKNIVSINTKEIVYRKSKKSFSVRLLNYVEPFLIKGQRYTLFYTEVDHNLKMGDRVFITGGVYDSDLIIQSDKFKKQSDGYIVQFVDRTIVVLDIEYTGDLPYVDEPIDNFVKVFVVQSQSDLTYYLQNFSTRSFKEVSNKFSWFGTYSTSNLLYLDGTYSITANNYGIQGFENPGTTTYGNAFLRLSGTFSGVLEDMNYYVIDRKRKITGYSIVFLGFTYVYITCNLPINQPLNTYINVYLSDLNGTGSYTSLEGVKIVMYVVSNYTMFGITSGSYTSTITDGFVRMDGLFFSKTTNTGFYMIGNDNLKIINQDFTHNGVEFKKSYTYYYDVFDSEYKVERKYLKPIITEQNFRNGFFKAGEFNQGLLGTHQETIDYSGQEVKFTLGTVLNVDWEIGNIGSGVGSDESYYTSFDDFGLPQIKINGKNNAGVGYNYFYDSYIKLSTILNGTFTDNIIGSESNIKVLNNYYKNTSTTYSVNIKRGNYYDNEITNASIINSSIFGTKIENSNISNSKSANSEIHRSLFYKSKFISDKVIKITGYDEKTIFWWSPGAESFLSPYKLFKFYISEESYKKIKQFRNFYISDLSFNSTGQTLEFLSTILDDKFTFDSYFETFDRWWSNKGARKTTVQLSSPEDNKYLPIGVTNSVVLNDFSGQASIDILMQDYRLSLYYPGYPNTAYTYVGDLNSKIVDESYGPFIFNITPFISNTSWDATSSVVQINYSGGSPTISGTFSAQLLYEELNNLSLGTWTYSGVTFSIESSFYTFDSLVYEDGTDFNIITIFSTQSSRKFYREKDVVNISKSYISDSDFVSGLFLESTWINGNYIPYNRDNSFNKNVVPNKYLSNFYNPVSIDNILGNLEISVSSNYRKEIFEVGDILFTNALYYSNVSGGADNLVKMPNTYEIDNLSLGGGGRTFTLLDPISGTSSKLYNIPSATNQSVLLTKFALNQYNYLHPVKFENSKIESGIFKRTYFENCEIYNQFYDAQDKDPVNFNNWRRLIVSDTIFADNSNKIKSGTIIYSHFTSGSDKWINGIFTRGIWNVQSFTWSNTATGSSYFNTNLNKFENGIFKNANWVNGVFSNGLFYKNNSNKILTTGVYNDSIPAYYINRTFPSGYGYSRYTWQDGIFENGRFELSNWENGTFSGGDFYNSNFLQGDAYGGNFGKKNLRFDTTRILSGSFSNLNVISADFRAENPTGVPQGNFQIDWYSGVFNNGYFGVKVHSSTYSSLGQAYNFNSTWYDGTFNNGNFADIAVWKDGEFNGGKFLSYYGYPWTTAASYSSASQEYFAWQNGEFNGGEFGNANLGTNSTWFNGNFNGGLFTARVWMNGNFTKGWFLGSGTLSTVLSNVPEFLSNFSESFYGLWYSGYVVENKKVDLSNKKRLFTKLEREFTKKRKKLTVNFRNVLWKGGTFSHNDGLFENSVWLDGNFSRGKFYLSSFNPYANYIVNGSFQKESVNSIIEFWEDKYTDYSETGDLIGSNLEISSTAQYTNDLGKKLNFSGTSSIVNLSQTAGLVLGETYTLKAVILENYNTEIRFGGSNVSLRNRNFTEGLTASNSSWVLASTSSTTLPTFNVVLGSPGYIEYSASSVDSISFLIYPNILIPGQSYTCKFYTHNESSFTNPYVGSCDSSLVSIEDGVLQTSFIENTSLTYSVPFGNSNEYQLTFVAAYSDLVIYTVPNTISTSYRASGFILTGNDNVLTSSDINSRTSYSYAFTAEDSNFSIELTPKTTVQVSSVPTWDVATCSIYSLEVIKGNIGFNTSESCIWRGGIFEESEFYVSQWETGKWITGTAVGMIWKNGVANYMNAYNVFWEGGVWRNGNWNGAPFNFENVNPNGCLSTYGTEATLSLTSPMNNLDLGNVPYSSLSRIFVHDYGNGASFSFNDSPTTGANFYDTWEDPELEPDSGTFVTTVGFPFVKSTTPNQFTIGNKYRVTITIGTVSIANQSDLDKVGLQFSLGKPGSESALYGETTGTYEGSLYSGLRDTASGFDFISNFYKLENLENHSGSVITDLLITGVDGYLATTGGQVSEVLTARDDGKFYLHISPYGVAGFYIDNISIQEEFCTNRIEINDGYVSDILTSVALYRQNKGDEDYREIFINDAFTVSVDPSYSGIAGQPNLTVVSFTFSNFGSKWKFANTYDTYGLIFCNTSSAFSSSPFSSSPVSSSSWAYAKAINTNQNTNFWIDRPQSVYLRAIDISGSQALFTALGEYDIEIQYIMQYGPTASVPIVGGQSTYLLNASFDVRVGYSPGYNNGGYVDTVSNTFRIYRIGCSGTQWFGSTDVLTYKSTFEPTALAPGSDLERLLIRKNPTIPNVRLHILSCSINKRTSRYDSQYNNATYSIFDTTPSYTDKLLIPIIDLIGGQSNGNLISTRFGNGIFTSGTASAFSSIWENGVWNDGYRMDKYIYVFENFGFFLGTAKPYAFSGEIINKKSKIGVIPTLKDKNLSLTKTSRRNWVITLKRKSGILFFESQTLNQNDNYITDYFKVGDRVAVGNIVAIDLNDKRRLIKDYFTVVDLDRELIYLQITLNFPVRRISKDSDDHLIYVSKNIWLSGAFLNGKFRGVWSNGLFKGRPYITKMIDSQWIDGRFDGGTFKGLTLSAQQDLNEENSDEVNVEYFNSGLIQNFTFKDNNVLPAPGFKYNSWLDINFYKTEAVAINKDNYQSRPSAFQSGSFQFAENNYYGYPTVDILSSVSYFRNSYNNLSKAYRLGYAIEKYDQLIPFDGEFKRSFDSSYKYPGVANFFNMGFTFSEVANRIQGGSYDGDVLYRFRSNTSVDTSGIFRVAADDYSHATDGFGIEDGYGIRLDNVETEIEFGNYTMIEFSLNYQGATFNYYGGQLQFPLNLYAGLTSFGAPSVYSLLDPLTIYDNTSGYPSTYSYQGTIQTNFSGQFFNTVYTQSYPLNHLLNPSPVKREYFYNRPEINFWFTEVAYGDNTDYYYEFDYIKYWIVDQVPFFRYATESRINQSILAPFSAVAPFIDYSDNEFSLIDSINITETIFETVTNPVINVSSSGTSVIDELGIANLVNQLILGNLSKIGAKKFPSGSSFPTKETLTKVGSPTTTTNTNSSNTSASGKKFGG
jgi:hypothetical protein